MATKDNEYQAIESMSSNLECELVYLEKQLDPYDTSPPRPGDSRGYYEILNLALNIRIILGKSLRFPSLNSSNHLFYC